MYTFTAHGTDPSPNEARAMAVHAVGPPPTAVSARYFKPTVKGPVYRAGGGIPAKGGTYPMSLTRQQLERVAAQLRESGPLLWEHDKTIGHAGYVTAAHVDDDGVLHAEATLYSPSTWTRAADLRAAINAKQCRSFSLAWDEDRTTGEVRAVELSVCKEGFFPEARIASACASAPRPRRGVSESEQRERERERARAQIRVRA